ncbi:uncharacterized protein LOC115878672 [Sitophilus oryzae]|uniref:Uncharacterized protein LOC115878672 n=1 Tax=Sitophilus oryzae TaxID=7048 RepID=A0A6J2XKC1_SITOR|nr:uncharacterized protein LOC115878672 [Sitophilus oryzae]
MPKQQLFIYIILWSIQTAFPQENAPNCQTGAGAASKIRTAGTGTVLFTSADVYKTCWSQDEIAVLTARMILEDVIPETRMISIRCNDDVSDLVEYFKSIINAIRSCAKSRKKHIMLQALTDLLGGYLHHAVLPIARKGYYAGVIDFDYIEKLIQLYEELKWFLRTNGQGWTTPLIVNKEINAPPVDLEKEFPTKDSNSSCLKLLFYEHEPLKARKRRNVNLEKGIYFPLPFFDSKHRPSAIVVPLKKNALRNIESRRAAYVLMKYYMTASRCLKEKQARPELVQKFQNNLFTFIDHEVMPKLGDDKFYAAFGGVERILKTLKHSGARAGEVSCNEDEGAGEEELGALPSDTDGGRTKMFLIAMLIVIFAWFIIGTCFICYRMRNSKKATDIKDKKRSSTDGSTSCSSKWSSFLSKSSSRSSSKNQYCKCCESLISEKSGQDYVSTSDYSEEKTKKKPKRRLFGSCGKRSTQSSPCICTGSDSPPIIEAKQSAKVLPSIAEMSEKSQPKEKKSNLLRKITFAKESSFSSSEGSSKPCAPPWLKIKNTVPCPAYSDKTTNYTSSKSNSNETNNLDTVPLDQSTKKDSDVETTQTQETHEDKSMQSSSNEHNLKKWYQSKKNEHETSTEAMEDLSASEHHSKEEENKEEPADANYDTFHMSACHTSMSGAYDLYRKSPDYNKPFIFGYDFQTTTSSDMSEDEDD